MTVTLKLDVTDETKRTIRAALGRGGMATRQEVRIFALRAFTEAIQTAPEPKRTRRKPEAPEARVNRSTARQAAQDAPMDALCARCGRPKSQHGLMAFTCLPTPGEAPKAGAIFTPAPPAPAAPLTQETPNHESESL